MRPHPRVALWALALWVLALGGCGYTMQKVGQKAGQEAGAVDAVRMGRIENRTFEPKLGDRLNSALVAALTKNGIRVEGAAPYALEGEVREFSLRSLAEKEGVTVSYEVLITGDFFLVGPGGEKRKLRDRGVFIVSFSSQGALPGVLARKEEATLRALEDLSEEIAASILYD